MKSLNVLVLTALLSTGCHTFHLKNGSDATKSYDRLQWHHIGIMRLVEYSEPVDIANRCEGKDWSAVRTQQSVGQVFLSLAPYLGWFWSPREVAIACK